MNLWLKKIDINDDKKFFDVLMTLSTYPNVYARPVPPDFTIDEFDGFKKARIQMDIGEDLPKNIVPTTTYWVMDDDKPVGYATLKHYLNEKTVGGHFGLCLLKEYQNLKVHDSNGEKTQSVGLIISDMLSKIAYEQYGIKKVIYTSKKDNIQSQKSIIKILGYNHEPIFRNDYYIYEDDLEQKFNKGIKR